MTLRPAASEPQVQHRGLVTAAVVLGPLMQILDSSSVSVALRHMQGSLSAAQDQVSWVLTSYLVAVAIMTPMAGVLSARIGRKRLFLISVVGFTISSMFSGMSDSLTEIIIFRFIQGIFGASLVPLSQSILLDTYPRERHGMAMAWWGVGIMFGPVFGPTLGGYITEYYSWRWIFYLNLPVGLFAYFMIYAFVRDVRQKTDAPFSYIGFLMLAVGIAAFQLILDRGERLDWLASPQIVTAVAVSVAGFYAFAAHTVYARRPFIDPAIFRDRNFVIGLGIKALFGIMLLGILALLPPFMLNLVNFPVVTAGLVMAPRGLATMVASLAVGWLLQRYEPRPLIMAGMLITAFSTWQLSTFTLDVSPAAIVMVNLVQGVGFGFFFVPLSTATFSTLPVRYRDVGTGLYALTGNIGKGLGVSIVVSFLVRNTQINREVLTGHITPYNEVLRHLNLPDMWNLANPSGIAALEAEITRQASVIAYINDFRLLTAMLLVCTPLVMLMRRPGGGGWHSAAGDT